jgi:hypothetical protein
MQLQKVSRKKAKIKMGLQGPSESINKYFIGNFAKQWAMRDGCIPTYLGYENGVIRLKLVNDLRIKVIRYIIN